MTALRPATLDDLPWILGFLRRHEQTSMFPLANLAGSGLGGAGPHGMRIWLAGEGAGLLGLTNGGMLQPQWPGGPDPAALRPALAGERASGAIGPAAQITALVAALCLSAAPRRYEAVEPGFALDLARLVLPPGEGALAPLDVAAPDLLCAWRADYLCSVTGAAPAQAAELAPVEVARWRASGSHRVLLEDGRPVALCGFNARLPDVVQVGGVYVPPALRSRGRARRAIGLLLAEAQAEGVQRAVLFAASDAAARCYRALGFLPADPMGLILFAGPQEVPPWP